MTDRCRLLAMFAMLVATPSWAQDSALTEPRLGIYVDRASVSSARATTACPAFIGDHRDEVEASIPKDSSTVTCAVARVDTLGYADALQWQVVKYLTRYAFPADSFKRRDAPLETTDTAEVLDVVVYSRQGGDSAWYAEWHGWAELSMVRDIRISIGTHGRMAVFSVVSCVSGTGGCDQHFLGRASGKWVPLNEPYRAKLERRFGNVFWKGVVVDVRTLRGAIPLYSSGDSNCCPSRELRLTLGVQGTNIVVKTATPRRR